MAQIYFTILYILLKCVASASNIPNKSENLINSQVDEESCNADPQAGNVASSIKSEDDDEETLDHARPYATFSGHMSIKMVKIKTASKRKNEGNASGEKVEEFKKPRLSFEPEVSFEEDDLEQEETRNQASDASSDNSPNPVLDQWDNDLKITGMKTEEQAPDQQPQEYDTSTLQTPSQFTLDSTISVDEGIPLVITNILSLLPVVPVHPP